MGFPDRLVTKLKYHTLGTLTSTSGAVGTYQWRWNSTFDPDITNTGHQPLYRDTYASLYDQYAVVSASAIIKVVNTNTAPFICGVVTDDDASPSTNLDTLCEQNHGEHTLLPPQTGALSAHTFRVKWNCKSVLGIDPFSSELYKTAVGSNPTEQSDLTLWAATSDASTNTLLFEATIVQEVLWTELSTPTQS